MGTKKLFWLENSQKSRERPEKSVRWELAPNIFSCISNIGRERPEKSVRWEHESPGNQLGSFWWVGNNQRSQYDGNNWLLDQWSDVVVTVGNDQRSQYDGNNWLLDQWSDVVVTVGNDQRSRYDGNV